MRTTCTIGKISKVILWSLLAIGLYGALTVSYSTYTADNPCPSVSGVYICYVVLVGYLMMVAAQYLKPYKVVIFYFGWIIVFSIALLGSGFETYQSNTCPQSSSGLPLCYVSMFISGVIGILFWIILNQKINNG